MGAIVSLAVLAAAVALAVASRGAEQAPKRPAPAATSQRFGDDADLMRRLERKKLVEQSR